MRSIGASLAAALVLALDVSGAQAAAGGVAASGRVVSVQAVPPAPAAETAAAAQTRTPPRAHSAAAHSETISGFAFHPGSITVTAGETISWTNEDSAPHTATADDGSFDTGQLAKGASGSHTFTTAGTFPYHCAIHPSMQGTVTVVAAAGSGGSGTTAPPPPAPPPTPAPASSTAAAPATLPRTGWDPAVVAAVGAALLLAGCALRARTRPR